MVEFRHELVVPNEDIPFRMFLFEGKDGNYKVTKHWHGSLEIFVVEEGELDFSINSNDYPLGEMDFILVNSNEIHSIDAPRPNRTIVLQIPMENFAPYNEAQPYLGFERKTPELGEELVARIREMFADYERKEYGYELRVKGQFYAILHLLLTRFQMEQPDQETLRQKKHLDRLSKVTEYMQENYDKELTLEEVAGRFGFTPTYLSRMFRKYAEVNYRTYLLDLRVTYAVRELINTDATIGAVAMRNGFPDSRAFAKAFRKRYGCLPRDYRASAVQQSAIHMPIKHM